MGLAGAKVLSNCLIFNEYGELDLGHAMNDGNLISRDRIRGAWLGRVSGCLLGKPLEVLSFEQGRSGLQHYLRQARAWPLRDYAPLIEGTVVERRAKNCCAGFIERAEPDDDLNYTILALSLLERHGAALATEDVARAWLNQLPAGATWTAERAAYEVLLTRMDPEFVNGAPPGFDLKACSDNKFNDWIGAQIRADLYGWVCPGRPALAVRLATLDAGLSHRGEGLHGAAFIAALGAAIPSTADIRDAIAVALEQIPAASEAAAAVRFALDLDSDATAVDELHERYADTSPVHTLNNLAVVVWAVSNFAGDFSAAIGNTVMAGWDTDSNGATVGGLVGLSRATIDERWTRPWQGRVGSTIAGIAEVSVDELVERTLVVANGLWA